MKKNFKNYFKNLLTSIINKSLLIGSSHRKKKHGLNGKKTIHVSQIVLIV